MLKENMIRQNGASFLVTSFVFWCLTAAVLLPVAAAILNGIETSAVTVGIVSSLLSFMCGLSAGFGASSKRGSGALYSGLVAGVCVVTALLSIGFLTEGSDISPDGVMSVASFTLSGCVLGSILQVNRKSPIKGKKKSKHKFNFT